MSITFEGRVPPILAAPSTDRRKRLRQAMGSGIMVMPGAYDCITARIAEKVGFNGLYLTGSGISMSALGAPDVALMSFGEILDHVKRIADCVDIPILADADTGYGGPLNVIRTVREFEHAGIAAIQIEDQAWPKKCGHETDRRLVDVTEMVGRIHAAVDARTDADFVIVARTDARSSLGLEAAIERGNHYAEAGADVIFVESPESGAELEQIARMIRTPLLANMVEGGKTPIIPADKLERLGFRMVIYPNAVTRTVAFAAERLFRELSATGTTAGKREEMYDHRQLWDLFDYPSWTGIERKYTSHLPRPPTPT